MDVSALSHNKKYKLEEKRIKEEEKRVKKLNERYEQKLIKFRSLLEKKKKREAEKLKKLIDTKYEKISRKQQGKKPLKKHTKTISTAKLKQKLYKLVQLYSRLRDTDITWFGKCISCWRTVYYKKADGWHYISRKYMMSAFDPNNINMQCKYCNWQLKWNIIEYRKWLIEKIWEKKVEMLENNKYKLRDWKRSEVIEMIAEYKKKVKQLEAKKQKPLL